MGLLKKILNKLSDDKKESFYRIRKANNIPLDFRQNKSEYLILKEIFEERVYAEYFPFNKNSVIMDVGAHFGYFSLFASRNSHKDSIIYSFEPSSENFRMQKKNISDNKIENVKLFQCAIGDSNGRAKLFHSANPNHSLLNDGTSASSENVEVKTLETVVKENGIQQIDFLKLDCEGAEYRILETLPAEIFQIIKTISMEFHDLKSEKYNNAFLADILRKHNFRIVKNKFDRSTVGKNYGKIIATK